MIDFHQVALRRGRLPKNRLGFGRWLIIATVITVSLVSGCMESLDSSDAWLDVPASLFVRTHDVPTTDADAPGPTVLDVGPVQEQTAPPTADPVVRSFAIQSDTQVALTAWVEPAIEDEDTAAGPVALLPPEPLEITTAATTPTTDAPTTNARDTARSGPEATDSADAVRPSPVPAERSNAARFGVQFDAFLTRDAAERESSRLRSAYPDLLGDRQLTVQTAEQTTGGIAYRVATGPFPDRRAAAVFCTAFLAREEGCAVIAEPVATQRFTQRDTKDQARDGLFQQFLLWQQQRDAGTQPTDVDNEALFEQFLRWRQQRTE